MTSYPRRNSNARLRLLLDQMMSTVPVGATINIHTLAQDFQKTHKSLDMNPWRASCLIRERDDVRFVDHGVWQKVGL